MTKGRVLGFVPIVILLPGLIALVVFFYPERVNPPVFAFELPSPFSSAHSFFLSVSALIVAYFFGRGFMTDGSFELLQLGGASLILGLGFLLSQVLGNQPFGGPNQLIGISSVTFLVSGLFYGAYAGLAVSGNSPSLANKKLALTTEYLFGIALIIATVLGFESISAPTFFQPGVGPTLFRNLTLGIAAVLFAATSATLIRVYAATKDAISYWFALGLASIFVGFLSALLGKVPGGLFSWLGRISLALGGVYFSIAIFEAYRSTRGD